MNLDFMADFSESRNQSGFTAFQERELRRVSGKVCPVVANGSGARRFTDSFTDSGHSARRISFILNEVEMEARVGIGQISPPLQFKYALFHWGIKQKRFYPNVSFLIRLVSVLVSAQ